MGGDFAEVPVSLVGFKFDFKFILKFTASNSTLILMTNSLVNEAKKCFQKHELARAESLLKEAIDQYPQDLEARYHLSNLLCIHKRFEEAIQTLQPAADAPGIHNELEWLQFNLAWMQGDIERARQSAARLLEQPNLTRERMHQLLNGARQTGALDLALLAAQRLDDYKEIQDIGWIQHFYILLKYVPKFLWQPFFRRTINRLEMQSRWRGARLLAEAAHASDGTSAEWPRRLGQQCRHTRDAYDPQFNQERSWYETALSIDKNDWEAFYGWCLTLFDMGNWQELLDASETSDIKQPWPIAMKAACLANLQQFGDAAHIYKEHYAELGDNASLTLGLIAMEIGKAKQALPYFVRIEAKDGMAAISSFFQSAAEQMAQENTVLIDGQPILDAMHSPEWFDANTINRIDESKQDICFLCNSHASRKALWRDSQTGWLRARCPQCGMISVTPIPESEEIRQLYVSEERSEHTLQRRYKEETENLLNADEKDCRDLPLYHDIADWGGQFDWQTWDASLDKDKRYLDVGCSAGRAVLAMQTCGWNAQGVDLDSDAVQYGKLLGLNLKEGMIEDIPQEESFHLITLLDVIEHVSDPIALLCQCYKRLQSGGLIVVKTPCADSLPHYLVGNGWLESKEHLHFFSRQTLRQTLEQAGFHILAIRQTMEAPTHYLHYQKWQGRFFPELFYQWIHRLQVGDTISILGQRPEE